MNFKDSYDVVEVVVNLIPSISLPLAIITRRQRGEEDAYSNTSGRRVFIMKKRLLNLRSNDLSKYPMKYICREREIACSHPIRRK